MIGPLLRAILVSLKRKILAYFQNSALVKITILSLITFVQTCVFRDAFQLIVKPFNFDLHWIMEIPHD